MRQPLVGLRPLQPPGCQPRRSLELPEAPWARRSRAVAPGPVELVALAGVPRLGLEHDEALARGLARAECLNAHRGSSGLTPRLGKAGSPLRIADRHVE